MASSNRKRGTPAAPAAPEPELEAEDIEAEGLPWEEDLDQWQAGERVDDSELNVVLYRLLKGRGKERVWKWVDEIPDEHRDIGLVFGSGTYIVYAVLSGPDGFRKVKHRRFTLAASYDAERTRAQREQGLNLAGPAGGNLAGSSSPNQFEMMLALMERVIVPLLAARGAPAAGGDLSHWTQANEIVGRVVEASATSQLNMSREVGKMLAHNGPAAESGDEAGEGDFKDYLKSVIMEYGPSLIEAAGLKLKAMAGVVKRDEVYSSLASNPELFGRVVKLLAKDPDVDIGQVEKVLTKLKGIGVAVPLPPGFTFAKPPAKVNGAAVGTTSGG